MSSNSSLALSLPPYYSQMPSGARFTLYRQSMSYESHAGHKKEMLIAGDRCRVANISSNTNTGTTVITQVAEKNPSELLYISLSFGFSLAVNAWVFFRISGGLFNPAVGDQSPMELACAASFQYPRPRLTYPGNGRHGSHRRHLTRSRHSPVCHPNRRGHSRGIYRTGVIPRQTCGLNHAWRRNHNRPGRHYRDDSDRATRLHHIHAGSRKAPGELHRASRDRTESFHRRARR